VEILLLEPVNDWFLGLCKNAPAVADKVEQAIDELAIGARSSAGPWSTGFMGARSIISTNSARGWAAPARSACYSCSTPPARRSSWSPETRRDTGAGGTRKRSRSRRNATRCINFRTAKRSSDEGSPLGGRQAGDPGA